MLEMMLVMVTIVASGLFRVRDSVASPASATSLLAWPSGQHCFTHHTWHCVLCQVMKERMLVTAVASALFRVRAVNSVAPAPPTAPPHLCTPSSVRHSSLCA